MSKGHQSQLKRFPIPKDGTTQLRINHIVLNYNPKSI